MIEIKKKGTNSYIFKLKTQNGHTLFKSVEYKNKADIEHSVHRLNPANRHTISIERKTNHEGLFLFDIKNSKGKLIGHSQHYSSEAGMENGIGNLKKRIDTLVKIGEL